MSAWTASRNPRTTSTLAIFMLTLAAAAPAAPATPRAGELTVITTSPAHSTLDVSVHDSITVTFNQPINPATVLAAPQNFWAYGRWSGPVSGTFSFANNDKRVTLTPDEPFFAGEQVFVVLSHDLESDTGAPLRSAGYAFSFWTNARRAPINYAVLDTLDCRDDPEVSTRAYGGVGSDLNNDGYVDLAVVQEDTADLRVFMNLAQGDGMFGDFIQPFSAIGNRASPSEPTDFNMDGEIDICTADINDNTVSILLGNGDGTFQPRVVINVGSTPRGIAVLDFDGDGFIDIVTTNNGGNGNVSLIGNLGGGLFTSAQQIEFGITGEWSLTATDMNHDGIFDLVIGASSAQAIMIQLGNGDGTFSFASETPCGGRTWMLVTGDVNGDGFEDVATANGQSNNGAILQGDGKGGLGAAEIYSVPALPLATDLGDIDGDGDLDWTTSSFFGSAWRILLNDGTGLYTVHETVIAPEAGSCTIIHDIDNDGDMDMALIDELADVVLVYQNSGVAIPADFDGAGVVDLFDFAAFLDCSQSTPIHPDCEVFDADNNRAINLRDFGKFQIAISLP